MGKAVEAGRKKRSKKYDSYANLISIRRQRGRIRLQTKHFGLTTSNKPSDAAYCLDRSRCRASQNVIGEVQW